GRPSTSHAVRDPGPLTLLLDERDGLCAPGSHVLRQEIQHGGADLVGTLCYQVSPSQNGVVAERDKASIRYTVHDTSHPLRHWSLVPIDNQQPRSQATDGVRGDTRWTNEGEGGQHLWVRGGKSRPIPWCPARKVGVVNAQVLQ